MAASGQKEKLPTMPLRIGIDYTAAAWQGAGIGRYTRELVRDLVAQGDSYSYTLFYAAGGLDSASPYLADLRQLCATHRHVRSAPIPLSPRRLTQIWQRARLPLPVELFAGPLDIVHAPDFVLPPTRARTIVTIHDLSFLIYPEFAAPGMVRYLSSAVPRSLRRADAVLADSIATRDDLARLLRIDPARVSLVYPGVSPRFRPLPPDQIEPVRRRLGLPDRFILFVSTLEPRKNLVRLIEAFARLLRRSGEGPAPQLADLKLVIGGRRGWLYEEIFAAIERLHLGQQICALDYVDDNDLPALYNLADVFAYPSVYEGFGLPALEALACGTPVLTADNSSLPEAVGDAAVLVPAGDVDAIAAGLARLLADPALRARLRAAGPLRARQFTWARAAQQVLECYRQVIPSK
jgi:glycosyltransferase involved in cell wall biosynthesis